MRTSCGLMLLTGAVTTDGHVGYVAGRYRSGVWSDGTATTEAESGNTPTCASIELMPT